MVEDHREKDKAVKKSLSEDKMRLIAEKAERALQKELCNIVKQLTGKSNRQTAAVKSRDGELPKNKEARFAR